MQEIHSWRSVVSGRKIDLPEVQDPHTVPVPRAVLETLLDNVELTFLGMKHETVDEITSRLRKLLNDSAIRVR